MGGENVEIVNVDNYLKELYYEGKERNGAVTRRKLECRLRG